MPSAMILGLAGTVVTPEEAAFFRDGDPWGFILFRRNVESPDQVRALCAALRAAVGRDAPILVDQEGGRVQRLGPPHWAKHPPAAAYHRLDLSLEERLALCRLGARLIAAELADVGIDVDCVPCLDVPVPGADGIIGDRAYADVPDLVARYGRAAAQGLLDEGVLPVIKHMPGHGRAGVDSHLALPRVDTPRADLEAHDFPPFAALADMPLGMTAHVVYEAIDDEAPATTSARVIAEVIRGALAFDGLLMTDDLGMHALAGSFDARARASLAAGCDVILHCSGAMDEMRGVASVTPALAGDAARRAEAALARRRRPAEPLDLVDARARLAAALAPVLAPSA
ncbi:beta-N-acetylhexosaminidase [Salinarimonas ramus]|uniref:beta-N-acetylhexosaminidase n=1 Tax=Salinarimonas ramus TaxID=690164 RepID=A0A917QGP8_9HYPH|nr:beta-N-acetylhexosaminidase [Salinarimonas ramus]GGK49751.1 beta-hexosaminidase [Salinarimonas ramus]